MIDRGGEKVSPREIEDALARHPDVERAAVFGVPDPVLTERIAAAVVLRAGAAPDADGLRRFTGRRIAPHKVPELITFRDALPVSATGKIQKHELARELEPVRETAGNDGPRPRTATEAALAGLWAFALDVAHVSVEDDFFARGGDSLAAVALLSTVEEVFGVVLGPQSLFDELNTVARMAAHIAARTGEAHDG
nr:phosphopantetheine-binding protein [Actinomadura rayongensis]